MKIAREKTRGITLIALILTMIILLILASVVLSIVLNSDSLIEKTNVAKDEWNKVRAADENMIEDLIYMVKSREKVDSTDNIFIAISEPNWTSDDITLVLSYDDIPVGYKIQYKIGDGPWQDGREILITDNTIVAVRLYNDIIDYETAVNTITINNIDKVAPTDPVTIEVVANINSIEVRATGGNDEKSGVAGYIYSLDNEHWGELVGVNETYIFDNIKADTDVTVYAKTIDNAGLESESIVQEGKTTTITSNVNIEQDTSDWTNENVEVTLSYDNIPTNYLLQYKKGSGEWTTIESGEGPIVENNNTIVIGRLYNSSLDDEIATNSITITNIDKEPPSAPTAVQISQGTTSSLIVQATGATDNGDEILYEYKIDNSDNWVPENGTSSAYTFTNVTDGEEHTIYARTVDRAKNRSESTASNSFTIAHVGGTHANGGTCTTCGQVYQTHTWGDWGRTANPTCTETGTDTRTCSCGETETRDVAALGHDYSTAWTSDGTNHWHACKRSECTSKSGTAGHSWGGWYGNTATCTAGGTQYRNCSVCSRQGSTGTSALGHTGQSHANGGRCTRCNTVYVSHSWGSWYGNTATCTSGGTEYRTCSCGAGDSRGTSALGHSTNGNGLCSRCNVYVSGKGSFVSNVCYYALGAGSPSRNDTITWHLNYSSHAKDWAYNIFTSTEAKNRFGSNWSSYVNACFYGILGRGPNSGETTWHISQFSTYGANTGVNNFVTSNEFKNRVSNLGLTY